jgi:hypothetical protein
MAARINPNLSAEWREKIKISMLINRLQENAFNELPTELTAGQLKSIEILLRKSLPDLANVQISGDEDKPLSMTIRWAADPKPE